MPTTLLWRSKAAARTALNIGLVGLLINYVGSGLEGTGGLGDYNLALDDGIRGCPTYEQVRQPSMDGFDRTKYTGRWYEHAFHDYTQFSDVYDTTLDIELSKDGKRWLPAKEIKEMADVAGMERGAMCELLGVDAIRGLRAVLGGRPSLPPRRRMPPTTRRRSDALRIALRSSSLSRSTSALTSTSRCAVPA